MCFLGNESCKFAKTNKAMLSIVPVTFLSPAAPVDPRGRETTKFEEQA